MLRMNKSQNEATVLFVGYGLSLTFDESSNRAIVPK